MAYKSFIAPTGSGNTIFEGDVLNGSVSPDGRNVVLRFFTNDRGYSCAVFGRSEESGVALDATGAKALRDELAALLEAHAGATGQFQAVSGQKRFTLAREMDGGTLILGVVGADPRFGTSYHRGDAAEMNKVLAEFDLVLKTISDLASKETSQT